MDTARPAGTAPVEETARLGALRKRLAREFPDRRAGELDQAIEQSVARFALARIRDFVPLFVERDVRARLGHPGSPG
jgi:hypothetical protein